MPLNGNEHLTSTIGLILTGGRSSRMKTDKSMLKYRETEQRYHVYNLFLACKISPIISCNPTQAKSLSSEYRFIVDEEYLAGHGPISGLLSAFQKYPGKNILVAGCDYPLITKDTITHLLKNVGQKVMSICYEVNEIAEPLIAIYKSAAHQELLRRFQNSNYSLRDFLNETATHKLSPASPDEHCSVDDPETRRKVMKKINKEVKTSFTPDDEHKKN